MKQKSILSLYIALTLVVCFICVGCKNIVFDTTHPSIDQVVA